MAAIVGKQAIVVGAGMGGLAAAGAAADYFERVIVLERELAPIECPASRRNATSTTYSRTSWWRQTCF